MAVDSNTVALKMVKDDLRRIGCSCKFVWNMVKKRRYCSEPSRRRMERFVMIIGIPEEGTVNAQMVGIMMKVNSKRSRIRTGKEEMCRLNIVKIEIEIGSMRMAISISERSDPGLSETNCSFNSLYSEEFIGYSEMC